MKLIKLIALLSLFLGFACLPEAPKKDQKPAQPVKQIEYKYVTTKKIIKDLKGVQEQHTDYHYKYDWLNGKFRQRPNIYTESQYYIIYNDNTHEEVNRDKW